MEYISAKRPAYQIPEPETLLTFVQGDIQNYAIVNEEDYRLDNHKLFLTKVLAAVGLTDGNNVRVAIISAHQRIGLSKNLSEKPMNLIMFGIPMDHIHFQGELPLHKITTLLDWKILNAHKLGQYQNDAEKKMLWQALKSMFNS